MSRLAVRRDGCNPGFEKNGFKVRPSCKNPTVDRFFSDSSNLLAARSPRSFDIGFNLENRKWVWSVAFSEPLQIRPTKFINIIPLNEARGLVCCFLAAL